MKRLVFFIVIIIVALGLLIFRMTRKTTSDVKTEKVEKGSVVKTVSASGEIASEEEIELKFQTSGQLTWVGVKEGDSVTAWQAIAQLDKRELQKNLEKALRDYSKERNDFEEERRVTYGVMAPENALTDTVKRILEKNQWDLDKAVLDVELKDIALKLATLVTPISGIVTHIDTPVAGVNITPATAVFKVASPDKVVFEANIDEADIAGVTPGMEAKIVLDAYQSEEFTGKVEKIAFSSVSTSGGGTAYPCQISLPENENLKFRLDMNGDIEIIVDKKESVLTVPSEAISEQNGENFVWLVKNGKATKTRVKVGLVGSDKSEIVEGLKEEDLIIKSPISKVKEGQRVN